MRRLTTAGLMTVHAETVEPGQGASPAKRRAGCLRACAVHRPSLLLHGIRGRCCFISSAWPAAYPPPEKSDAAAAEQEMATAALSRPWAHSAAGTANEGERGRCNDIQESMNTTTAGSDARRGTEDFGSTTLHGAVAVRGADSFFAAAAQPFTQAPNRYAPHTVGDGRQGGVD